MRVRSVGVVWAFEDDLSFAFLQKMLLVIFPGVEKVSIWCLIFKKYYLVACKIVRSFLLAVCFPSSDNWSVSEANPFREKLNISCALIYFYLVLSCHPQETFTLKEMHEPSFYSSRQ